MDRLADAFRDAPLGMALVAPGGAFLRVNSTAVPAARPHRGRAAGRAPRPTVVDDDRAWREALRDGGAGSLQIETPHAPPRRAPGRRARERDARARLARRAAVLRLPGPRHDRALRGAGATWPPTRPSSPRPSRSRGWARWEWEIAADRVTWSDELYRIYGVRPTACRAPTAPTSTRSTPTTARASARVIETARDRAPAVEPRLPDRAPRRRAAHDPRARRGRPRRARAARRSSTAPARTSPRAAASRTRCAPPSSSSAAPSTTRRSAWRSSTSTAAGCA